MDMKVILFSEDIWVINAELNSSTYDSVSLYDLDNLDVLGGLDD